MAIQATYDTPPSEFLITVTGPIPTTLRKFGAGGWVSGAGGATVDVRWTAGVVGAAPLPPHLPTCPPPSRQSAVRGQPTGTRVDDEGQVHTVLA